MAMTKFDVDSSAKLFIAKAGITNFNVTTDLYSDAKEHWIAGGAVMGFDFPIRAVAGDVRADASIVEPFYFMRDGWKIRPQEANHTLQVTGNIELDQGESGQLFVATLGAFTVLVTVNTTNRGTLLAGSGSDWTASELAQIRHRLGIDGTAQAPSADPSLALAGDAMTLTSGERVAIAALILADGVPFSGALIDAAISTRSQAGTPTTLTAGERIAVAAAVLTQDIGPLQVSASLHSALSAMLKLLSRFDAKTGRTYRLDGTTIHMTQTPSVDTAMKPIRELGVSA